MNSSFLYHGSYTHRFAKYVVDMLRSMTLKDAAARLGLSAAFIGSTEQDLIMPWL